MVGPLTILEPYFSTTVPQYFALFTSTLETSSNWLLLQYVIHAFASTTGPGLSTAARRGKQHVIFVTLLQGSGFWRDGARRIGFDLATLEKHGEVKIIDEDYLARRLAGNQAKSRSDLAAPYGFQVTLEDLERTVKEEIQTIAADSADTEAHLIIDGLDLLLSSTSNTAEALLDTIYELRSRVNKTVMTASADAPLIHRRETPLEVDHALFLTSLAHQASYVMTLRQLSTGAAKDVSGVLRITKGSAEVEPKELLYLVGRDGSAKVFERGAGG